MLMLSMFAPALLLAASPPATPPSSPSPPKSNKLRHCIVKDGDTVHCGRGRALERIRLLGIDAPELPGHCRRGRACAPGDPFASHAALRRWFTPTASITIIRTGTDKYGRTLGWIAADGVDLSCAQWRGGFAIYKPHWDAGARLRSTCR